MRRLPLLLAALAALTTGCGGSKSSSTSLPQITTQPALSSSARSGRTAASAGAAGALFQNGTDLPSDFRPYAPNSVWNAPVCNDANNNCLNAPQFADYSDRVIAEQFGSGYTADNALPTWSVEAGVYDFSHPLFYAADSDPAVSVRCNVYCGTAGVDYPTTVHIPAQARPAEGEDHHFGVVQPDGTEVDFWAVTGTPGNTSGRPASRNWQDGDTITAGAAVDCGNFVDGSGIAVHGPAATAGGACLGAGLIRPNELLAGKIDHALFLAMACSYGPAVYPHPHPGMAPDNVCTSGIGAPFGARLWYDVPDDVTNANPTLSGWERAILVALHDHGAYNMDTGGGGAVARGMQFLISSSEVGFDYSGNRSSWAQPLAGLGAYPITVGDVQPALGNVKGVRWTLSDAWLPQVDLVHHMHWLAPCSAQGSC